MKKSIKVLRQCTSLKVEIAKSTPEMEYSNGVSLYLEPEGMELDKKAAMKLAHLILEHYECECQKGSK